MEFTCFVTAMLELVKRNMFLHFNLHYFVGGVSFVCRRKKKENHFIWIHFSVSLPLINPCACQFMFCNAFLFVFFFFFSQGKLILFLKHTIMKEMPLVFSVKK